MIKNIFETKFMFFLYTQNFIFCFYYLNKFFSVSEKKFILVNIEYIHSIEFNKSKIFGIISIVDV